MCVCTCVWHRFSSPNMGKPPTIRSPSPGLNEVITAQGLIVSAATRLAKFNGKSPFSMVKSTISMVKTMDNHNC